MNSSRTFAKEGNGSPSPPSSLAHTTELAAGQDPRNTYLRWWTGALNALT